MTFNTEIAKLKTLLLSPKQITLLTHINPDGDAIGSILGLYKFLTNMGHTVSPIVPNNYPAFLKWMPNGEKIIIYNNHVEKSKKIIAKADLIFCLDFNDPVRIGEIGENLKNNNAVKILIDHHPMPNPIFDIIFSDTMVSSAAEKIYIVIKELNVPQFIDKQVAECLFTGIIADTGSFSFGVKNSDVFRNAAEIMDYGINKEAITRRLMDNHTHNRLKLLGYCLSSKLVVLPEYKAAYICLTENEKAKFDYQIGDSEGFVNTALSISNVIFSTFIMETDTLIKYSFRSKGNFDVNQFARTYFNGGGHKNASGGRIFKKNIELAENKFLTALSEYNPNK